MAKFAHDRDGNKKIRVRIRERYRTKSWRRQVIEKHGKCQKCGRTDNLTAHHKVSIGLIIERYNIKTLADADNNPEAYKALWDIESGECYCVECHDEIHNENIDYRLELLCERKGWKLNK